MESNLNETTLEKGSETFCYYEVRSAVRELVEELLVHVSQPDLDVQTTARGCSASKKTQKADYLTNIVPHGDYLHYKNSNRSMSNCSICSKDVYPTIRLSCSNCPNIMHRACSGFGKARLDDYRCPLCSMKEVSRDHHISVSSE